MKLCNFIEWSGRENNLGMPNRKFLPKKKLERRKDKPHKRSSSCDCGWAAVAVPVWAAVAVPVPVPEFL